MRTNEAYTPGYTQNAVNFMTRRSALSHAAFLLPHLRGPMRLLDCGCGPGSMTCDFARLLPAGHVTGLDREATQIDLARQRAAREQITNATFQVGSIYELPFPDRSFDVVFSHAIFEHLSSPAAALAELRRVLTPGGLVALRSPDWGGIIVGPETPGLQAGINRFLEIQTANGGDVHVGRKMPAWLRSAGFVNLAFSATYECYQPVAIVSDLLALLLENSNGAAEAAVLRQWSQNPDAVFAQAWCEIVGTVPIS